MMRTLIIAILLTFNSNLGFSQTNTLTQELRMIRDDEPDTTRIMEWSSLSLKYVYSNPDSALYCAEKALALSKQLKFHRGEVRSLSFMAGVYNIYGNLPKALSLAFEAMKIGEVHNHLGRDNGWPYMYISSIYESLHEYPKALYYGLKCIEITKSSKDSFAVAMQGRYIGLLYIKWNKLDSANLFLKKCYNGFKELKSEVHPEVYLGLGHIQAKLGHTPLALSYYDTTITKALSQNNYRAASRAYHGIAIVFRDLNHPDSAIHYATKAMASAEFINFKDQLLETSSLLASLYEPTDLKKALHYYKMSNAIKESMFGSGNIQIMQAMIKQEADRQKEIEATKKEYQNQLKQFALLAGLAVMFLIGFILYRNNRQKQKANVILQGKNEEIQSTLSKLKSTQAQLIQTEKLASLGELTAGIAHEIQNPLNFVNNFSELSVELIKELKEEEEKPIETQDLDLKADLLNDLSSNQEKINHHGKRASSIVKGMLEHSRASTGERALTDINALADEYLRLSYHGMRAKDKDFNADYKTEFDNNLPKINVIPQDIGRVLLNLINNAFYAVSQRRAAMLAAQTEYTPSVVVSTQQLDNQIIIKVKDNGNGIPDNIKAKIFQPFFTTKPTGQGTGLGLSLAYDIVTKGHAGTLEVQSTEGVSSEFIISLPLKINEI